MPQLFRFPGGPITGPSRWARRLLWALGAWLLLWLLMWLGLPPLIQWQLQQRGSAALGRALTVERVEVRPWALSLDLHGLRVAAVDGEAPQLSVQRLYMNLELQSLLRWAPVVDALRIESPRLRLRHLGEGRLDIDDLVQRLSRPADAPPAAAEPARFALFNIELVDGEALLEDAPVGVTHRLQGVELAVPFLSNLGSRREVVTEPRLAFTLNGSRFDTRAATTPFADNQQTRVRLQIPDLDVQPYLVYWPRGWPARLAGAHLHLDVGIDFEQHEEPSLVLSGQVGVSQVQWRQGDAPLLDWQRLDLGLTRVEPLRRRAQLAHVRLAAPVLAVSRDARGAINLQQLLAGATPASATPVGAAAAPAPAAPWQVAIDEVSLADGRVDWRDAAVRPEAALALSALQIRLRGLTWPVQQAVPVELDARLGDTPLQLRGSGSDREAAVQASVGELPLSLFAPYLAQQLRPPLDGRLQATLEGQWRAATDGGEPALLRLVARSLSLDGLRLGAGREPLASLQRLEVGDAALDLVARRVEVARVSLQSPRVEVVRGADGRWTAQDWLPDGTSRADTPARAPAAAPAPAWDLRLGELLLQGGRIGFLDRLPAEPVSLLLDGVRLQVRDLQPLAARPPAAPLALQARLAQRAAPGEAPVAAEPARLRVDGRLQWPGQAQGPGLQARVQVERLPLHAFVPYVADRLNLELLHADAGLRGEFAWSSSEAGPALTLQADASLDDLRAHSIAPAEELLTWSSLQLRGLSVRMAPGEATSVRLEQTVLDDYFARVLIDEQGRINLQGLIKPAPAPAPAEAGQAQASAAPAPDIRIGPVSLVNGRVRFSDRFIRPNYTANLTDLTGSLSAFSSTPPAPGQPPALADLSLKGRAEGTAALDISGRINPLATPLAMDIRGQVRDLELPPLSPYSARYAGYGIERGKLSVDVRYRIEADGRLDASNQIVLNQLAFGERDPASPANLPVKLAVALLADRDGVIDINLPISGSLNDPQFRLGPIIVRVIVNLIGKALTAPFSLIASAFASGGSDASQVAFEPGLAVLDEADARQLDAVAKALQNRPALRLTIVGEATPELDRDGWQRERVEELLRAEKRRQLARAGAAVPARPAIDEAERPALLREAYRRADIPKPRNLIGIAKDIPPEEMRALLLAARVPDEQAMRELAIARAVAVRDALLKLSLGEDRVFLGAPRVGAAGASGGAAQAAPRVQLQLAPR